MPASVKPSLPDLQNWMRWTLTHPDGAGEVVNNPVGKVRLPKNWTRGKEPARQLAVIGQSPAVNQETRLSIYGDGYFLRIVGVMASNFSCIRAVLGDHDFDDHVAREYLVKYPSVHKCIDNIGDRLPSFLRTHSHSKHFSFLPDLARLEWAFHESFYSDELPLLDPESLRSATSSAWERAKITLDPSVRLLDLKFPVVPLWREDGKWDRKRLRTINARSSPTLVFRNRDMNVRVSELDKGEFSLLKAFKAGKKLGAALRSAARNGMTPATAMGIFQEWTRLGIIRRVDFR
jgi:hypothetical protein